MIQINSREDLEALHHLQTLESITDQAIKEAKEQQIVAAQVLETLGWKNAEARRMRRAFILASVAAGFWFAAALYWMWRAVH
jgi:hypothetical protein